MRLLEMVFYLLRTSSRIKIKELAEKYNVSEKTIQRDLEKLSIAGIPITIYRGKNGGVEVDKSYVIKSNLLRYEDYDALLFSLYLGESISADISKKFLIDRFKSVDYSRATDIVENLNEKFVVDLYEEKIDFKNEICKAINKGLENKLYIKIKIKKEALKVVPISYVLKNNGLFLYCYDKEYKLILINEISYIINTNENYTGRIINYKDNKENLKLIHKC